MAYVKTTWVDNTTPEIDDDNLNKMENGIFTADANATTANTNIGTIGSLTTTATNLVGAVNEVNAKAINLENVTKYITVTAASNGDFKCTLSNTLATNMELDVIFPSATTATSNARLSIDNGSTYKNIMGGATNQLLANKVASTYKKLFYDGTQWRCESNLVAYKKLAVSTEYTSGAITVDIVRDGGIYDIVVKGSTDASRALEMYIERDTTVSNYSSQRIYIADTNITAQREARPIVGFMYTRASLNLITLSFYNGYASSYTCNTLVSTAGQAAECLSYFTVNNSSKTNITSLEFKTYATSGLFVAGTEFLVYKRGL